MPKSQEMPSFEYGLLKKIILFFNLNTSGMKTLKTCIDNTVFVKKTVQAKKLMSGSLYVLLLALAVSCDLFDSEHGDDVIIRQNHDKNKMMSLMHETDRKMDSLTMTMDPDLDYALMMIEHHKGAVKMAQLQIDEGKDSALTEMSKKMIPMQQHEIEVLDSFVKSGTPDHMDPRFHDKAHRSIMSMAKNADIQVITGDIDHDFAVLMIQHHQGAIDMSVLEKDYGNEEKILKLADKIKEDQKEEIMHLQDWLLAKDYGHYPARDNDSDHNDK
jgi:uncharacterized protein (DUF305 family)